MTGNILYFTNIAEILNVKDEYFILRKMGYSNRVIKKIIGKEVDLNKINNKKEDNINKQQEEILELYKQQKDVAKEVKLLNKNLESKETIISRLEKQINEKDNIIEESNRSAASLKNALKTIGSTTKMEIELIERQKNRKI